MADNGTERPIFVMGCPRSGTTMLQLMLHRHPRIAIPPENRFVLSGYLARRTFGDLRLTANRARLASWIVDRPQSKFQDLRLDAEDIRARLVDGPPDLGSLFAIVLRAYAERFGKPRWGDKRPAYVNNVDMIRRLFPTAQLVTIVRDGRDCCASLKEMPWQTRKDIASLAAQWAYAVDCSRRAARTLPADSYHELRYEDLVADPDGTLRELCAYLGEEFDPAMTRPSEIAADAVPTGKRWHSRTHQPVGQARTGSWRTRLTPDEIALCESVLRGRLTALGYEPSDCPSPRLGQRLRYAVADSERRARLVRQRVRDLTSRLTPR
ncbi:MAG: sulfotransferase [Hamadaea sp.]|uniref:sulfotransferase family protein n=1 Tax=Hamadaea sp. TaxID=2024425 RepID=UPI00184247D9|nr:sulfotransferase [Hamadaea sp.]NUR72774.1 sulfotransferase [Hamadaea sp.]NUT22878.1 sulfotransferase [Hamadaea sp.]